MSIDLAQLREIVATNYTVAIEAHYGESGMTALRRLAPALDVVHEELAYELVSDSLTVIAGLDPNERVLSTELSMAVEPGQLPSMVEGAATIEVLDGGALCIITEPSDPHAYADQALVYHFDGADHFAIDGQLVPVQNPTNFPSVWGTPTFFDLERALEHYRDRIAIHCSCPFLSDMWHDPDRRWLLRNKPEDTMQASLYKFLVDTLREHRKIEIRREQAVGGSRPPDLKVTWSFTNRMAFIEVKWMGASVHSSEPRVSWRPDESQANKGAKQLAEYLDENVSEASGYQTMGFLVVFDARRDAVDYDTEQLAREDALRFVTQDVAYDPDYSEVRHDFASPLRFFMRPLQPR